MELHERATNDERALYSANRIVLLGILVSVVVAYPTWLTARHFALFPWFPGGELSSAPFDVVYGVLLALTLLLSLRARTASAVWAFPLIFLLGLALDQARWTPFYLQYSLFLFVIAIELTRRPIEAVYALNALRVGVICVYFWAGIHKLNFNYIGTTFPWFISPISQRLPDIDAGWWLYIGLLSPCVETVLALLLFARATRLLAIVALIVMHLGILWCLGPLGHNYGMVVWSWNIVMCCLVWTLFRDNSRRITVSLRRPSQLLVLLVLGLLPSLNLVNRWDSNLSMHMYSGNIATMAITISKRQASEWPQELQSYLRERPESPERFEFDYWMWTLDSIGNIPSPEVRIYERLVVYICEKTRAGDSLKYRITEKRGYTRFARNSGRVWEGTCADTRLPGSYRETRF